MMIRIRTRIGIRESAQGKTTTPTQGSADFGEVLGFISDVEVESDQTTIQNIDTAALEASL